MAARTGRPARTGVRGDGRTERTTALVGRGVTPEVVGTWPFRSCRPRRAVSGDGTTIHGRRPQTLLDAGHDQPARRDSASVHGLCGSDQPARRDSWSRRGPRGSNSRPGGTQPAGAVHGVQPVGQAGNSLRTLGCGAQTVSSAVLSLRALGSGGRPACPAGLSLRERCFTSLPGGTEPAGAARGGRPAGPSVHIVQERATVLDQPGRRDLASVHGVCGFDQTAWRNSSSPRGPPCSTSPARGTQPPCAGRRCRQAGTAGLSLRALGSVVGLAVQVGLSLRSGPRGSTSLPSGTERPGTARGGRPASPAVGTPRPIAGHVVRPGGLVGLSHRARCSTSLPGGTEPPVAARGGRPAGPARLSLRARGTTSLPARTDPPWGGAAGVDHLARWDLRARRSRTSAWV